MSSLLGQFHNLTKWTLPLEHYSLDATHKLSTKSVQQTSDGLAQAAEGLGINSHLPRYWEGKATKDNQNFGRWGENSLGGIGAVLGGMYGYGALGAGGTGSGAGTVGVTGTDGAFLGEGVASGVPAWDSAYVTAGGTLSGSGSGLTQSQKNALQRQYISQALQNGQRAGSAQVAPTGYRPMNGGYQEGGRFIDPN